MQACLPQGEHRQGERAGAQGALGGILGQTLTGTAVFLIDQPLIPYFLSGPFRAMVFTLGKQPVEQEQVHIVER